MPRPRCAPALKKSSVSTAITARSILALALEHHIAIGRNVPLPMLLDWIVDMAGCGVVEFVPKDDPTVQRMLSIREDIFDHYSRDEFEQELTKRAAIGKREVVSSSGRTLYIYEKSPSVA